MKGRKEVRVVMTKGKLITGKMTGRRCRKKGTTEKAAEGKVNDQVDAKCRSYSKAVIEGTLRKERVFMADTILQKTYKTLSKGEDGVCLPGARIEHVTGRVDYILGRVCISTCWKEQCKQGGESLDSTEIQTIARETEEDQS